MRKKAGRKEAARVARPGRRKWVLLCGLLAAAVLVLGGRCLCSEKLEVTFHHLYSPKTVGGENIRVIVLSDLHNREFGPGNGELVERIAALRPDLIAIAGDMVNADDGNLDVILTLCSQLLARASVYYSPDNNESRLMYEKGSTIEGQMLNLGICGHYYGGQFRLPVVGGLYHGDTGLFPKYSGGMYRLPNSTIFVSRGMRGHNGLPRINNRPELAVIDINGRQETNYS